MLSGVQEQPQLRSCALCRQRKVKCDRQQPCSNCLKAGRNVNCIYPSGRGRAPKRRRQQIDTNVSERLSRLESMIRGLEQRNPSISHCEVDAVPTSSPCVASSTQSDPIEKQLGRLVIDNTRSYYIEELRNTLAETASGYDDDDEDEDSMSEYMAPMGSSSALLGLRWLGHSLQSYHPPLAQSITLLRVFTENVVPMMRIFHMPTTTRLFWDAVASLDSLDRNNEALIFAIYYSAVISLNDTEKSTSILGVPRKTALEKYRCATEQAMARANLLNTQSIILLQAVVLFILALRSEDDSRTPWSLTALVYHIAQAMGLHRDGTAFGLKPLETEVRRRLWYHICLLDNRSSEYHGYEPIVHEHGFDTRPPLHINDSDLTAEMNTSPPEREEACEMTFCLVRCEAIRIGFQVNHMPSWVSGRPADVGLAERQALVEGLATRLQQRYLRHCEHTNVVFHRVILAVARLIQTRTWLAVHYPLGRKSGSDDNTRMRDQLFLKSIEVLELSAELLTNPDLAQWAWHSKTHIQWHTVAFALSEICVRPSSPDCDRAWEHVCTVYDAWQIKDNGRNGTLWRPIKRLMAKARYVREVQKTDPKAYGHLSTISPSLTAGSVSTTASASMQSPGSSYNLATSTVDAFGDEGENGAPDTLDMEYLEPFMELFPDNLQVDIFGTAVPGINIEFDQNVVDSWFTHDTGRSGFE